MKKLRIIIEMELTAFGQRNLLIHNNAANAHLLADGLAKALARDAKHIAGIKVEIEIPR